MTDVNQAAAMVFNPLSPELRADPYPQYAKLREAGAVGAALARLEARHAFEQLFARRREIGLVTDAPVWRPSLALRALSELRVELRG